MPIRAEDDEVFDVRAVEGNGAVDEIREARLARRHVESNCAGCAGRFVLRNLLRREGQAAPIVNPPAALPFGPLSMFLQPVR